MQGHMCNIRTEMEILGKNKKEMVEIKNGVTEIKNVFHEVTKKLSDIEDRSREGSQPEIQRERERQRNRETERQRQTERKRRKR